VKLARFVGQIAITPGTFSAGGDSGSLIVTDDENKNPVGLLFAGSDTHTIANPIGLVLDRFNVTVDDGGTTNNPPTADFTYTTTDLTADFTDQSTDSDGSISSWLWDFGDEATSTAQNPSHTYATDGTYTVSLTVTDDDGVTDTTSQDVTVSSSTTNSPPTADFMYTTTDLTADFKDESTDSDGSVVSWSWDFGDGATSTAQNPSHTYATDGTYTVSLTVTDDDGATDTTSQDVTVSSAGGITLTATGYKVRGRHTVDLEWSGATSTNVDIYRDGALIKTSANDGFYTDGMDNRGPGSYTYQVCEEGTSTCSNEATVTF
jgi:PKD repeat protein